MDAECLDISQLLEAAGRWGTCPARAALNEIGRRAQKGGFDLATSRMVVRSLIDLLRRPIPEGDEGEKAFARMEQTLVVSALGNFGRTARIALPALLSFLEEIRNKYPPGREVATCDSIAMIVYHDEEIRAEIGRLAGEEEARYTA